MWVLVQGWVGVVGGEGLRLLVFLHVYIDALLVKSCNTTGLRLLVFLHVYIDALLVKACKTTGACV